MSSDFDRRLNVDRIYATSTTTSVLPQKKMTPNEVFDENKGMEVVEILNTKIAKDCHRQYLVTFRAWLPEERLDGYDHLISQFWKTQTTEGWDESNSDKENKYLPNGRRSPSYNEPYEKRSPQYEHSRDINGIHDNNDNEHCNADENIATSRDASEQNTNVESEIIEKTSSPNPSSLDENEKIQSMKNLDEEDKEENSRPWDDDDGNEMSHEYLNDLNKRDKKLKHQNSTESQEEDSMENFDSTETIDLSLENQLQSEKQMELDDSASTRPASSISDKTISSSSTSSSSKKRKLKTLDDIVRKISGTTDQPCEKKTTLDETLMDNSKEEVDVVNNDGCHETLGTSPDLFKKEEQPEHSPSHDSKADLDMFWSAGKAGFQKRVRAFRCFPCDQLYEYDYELRNHQRIVHGAETPNVENLISPTAHKAPNDARKRPSSPFQEAVCRQCNKTFESLSLLDRHRYDVHKARRRYEKCSYCATMYSDPMLLRRHELSHFRGYDYYRPADAGVHPNIPGGPLAESEKREYEGYPLDRNGHTRHHPFKEQPEEHMKFNKGVHREEENNSMVKNPIRNLLGKMHYTHSPPREQEIETNHHHVDPLGVQRQEVQHDDKGYPWKPQALSQDSIPYRYARFMQEQHGFPPDQLSPSPIHSPTGAYAKSNEEREKEGFQEFLRVCPVCKKSFSKKEAFDHHWLSKHNDQTIFNCDACKKTFFKEDEFNAHMIQHRSGFICSFCGQAFDNNLALQTHMKVHSTQDRPFQCHICGRCFSLKTNLRRHMTLHSEAMLVFRCQLCQKGLKTEEELNKHLQEFHGRFLVIDDKQQPPHPPPTTGEERFDRRCLSKRSPPVVNGAPHSPVYHQQAYRDQNREFYRENGSMDKSQTEHLSPHHLPPTMRSRMDPTKMGPVLTPPLFSPGKHAPPLHMPSVPPQSIAKLMKCYECNEEFTSKSLYEIHLQSHVKEVYSCPKCRKTFTKRSLFDSHLLSHENNKSHNCPYCHRSFSMKGNLRRHIRIHTNEAPYECPICFQRFRRSDGLKGHIKRHETMGESAPTDMVPSQASA